MANGNSRRKVATETGLYLVVLVAIVVVANMLSMGMNKRWDATANERYTLSEGSKRLVQTLKEPMLVDAYVTKGLARLDVYVEDLTSLLKEYEAGGNFQFTIIEAKTEELKERAKEAGLQPMAFAAQADTGDDQAAIAQGYLGLVLKYGSEKGTVPLDPRYSQGLEFLITNKIREIRDKADDIKHKVGLITGKDELKLDDTNLMPRQGGQGGGANIKAIIDQYFPFYEFVDVDLKGGEEQIDATLSGLIVTQPQKAYTTKELRRIDEFLMLGDKAVAVFASAVNIKPNDATMNATLNTQGLEALLSGYGMNLQKNLLLDFGAQFQTIVPTQGGFTPVRYPPIAHVADDPRLEGDQRTLDTSFASFFRLNEAAFPYPSGIEIVKDKQPADVSIRALARTTPNTTEITTDTVDLKLRLKGWEQKPPFEQHVIAAVAEGPLKSAFAGSENDEGVKVAEVAAGPSRILLIASSQFITNPFAYSGNGPELGGQFAMFGNVGGDQTLLAIAGPYTQRYLTNTILAVKNTLDWMTGDADLLEISAKIISEPNLKYADLDPKAIPVDATEEELKKIDEEAKGKRKNTQSKIQWALTLGIPALFALFGILRWRSRLSRRSEFKLA